MIPGIKGVFLYMGIKRLANWSAEAFFYVLRPISADGFVGWSGSVVAIHRDGASSAWAALVGVIIGLQIIIIIIRNIPDICYLEYLSVITLC